MRNILERLSSEQVERLRGLESSIHLDKMTVSFSIENRNASGQKKSAFYSASASREGLAQVTWSLEEAKVVSCILSKHVVLTTYRDAIYRGILSKEDAVREAVRVVEHYDSHIVRLLGGLPEVEGSK